MFVYEIDDCLFQSFDRAKAYALEMAEEWYADAIADNPENSEDWQRRLAADREEIASWAEDQGHYWEAFPYAGITQRKVF